MSGRKISFEDAMNLVDSFVTESKDVTEIRVFESPEFPDTITILRKAKVQYNPCRSGLMFSNENTTIFLNFESNSNIVCYDGEETIVLKIDSTNGNQVWFNLPNKGYKMSDEKFSFNTDKMRVSFCMERPIPEDEFGNFIKWFKNVVKDLEQSYCNTIYYHTKNKEMIEIIFDVEKLDK